MAAEEEIVAIIRADGKQLQTVVRGSQKAMQEFSKAGGQALANLTDKFSNTADKVNNSLNRINFRGHLNDIGEFGRGFLDLGRSVVEAANRQEQFEATFRQVTGSITAGQRELKLLQDEARKSSFSVEEIIQSGARLRQSGLGIDVVIKQLQQARDVAASTGEPLADISNFLARARRGDQDALTVLQERGIVSKEQLRKLGANFDKGTLAIKGQLKGDRDALNTALDKGLARFAGQDELRVDTFAGQFSNLQDEVTKAAATIGKEMTPVLKDLAVAVRGGVESFQKFTPETKSLIAQTILVGGALSAAAIAFTALAGPIGTILAVGGSLMTTLFLPLEVALLPIGLAIQKAGLALYGMGAAAAAAGPALLAAKGLVLGFGAAVVYMAAKTIEARKEMEAFDKQLQGRDDGLAKLQSALGEGGLKNLSKATAADLKRLGVTAKDLEKAIGGLQDAASGDNVSSEIRKRNYERIQQVRKLTTDLKALEKAEKDASSVDTINKMADPGADIKQAKEALKLELQRIDTAGYTDQQKIDALKELIANNKLLKEDEFERLKIQEKIDKLVTKQAKSIADASNKALNDKIKVAKSAGNSLDESAKNAAVQAAREPTGSVQRLKLEEDAFMFQRRANQARIAALQAILDKEKLTASQRTNIEQRIHSLVQKNEQARVQFINNRTKAEEEAAKKKEELQKKEANDLRDAQKANLEARQAAAERDIEQAKKAVAEGTADPGAVDAAINARQAISEELFKLNQEDEDASAKSEAARALNAETADIQIQQSRLEAQDAIREYNDTVKESAEVQKKASQETVQAVQQQVTAQKSAIQSLEDIQQQQSASFGIDAVRAQADAIDQRRIEKEAARKQSFKKANPEAVRAQAEVDRLRAEALRKKQFEDNGGQARIDANKARVDAIIASQTKKSPQPIITPTQVKSVASPINVTPLTPLQATRATQMASAAPQTKVDVHVAVTVKDTKGNVLSQDGPAKVTIGGRGSEYKSASIGMPYGGGGGLSSGVGMA